MVLQGGLEKSGIEVKHLGVVLEPDGKGFDRGATTFCCALADPVDPGRTYLYYTGADRDWSHAAIGVASSDDGLRFRKSDRNPIIDGNPGDFNSRQSVTPAVTRMDGVFYLFFSGSGSRSRMLRGGRRIGVAFADDPLGPWEVVGELATPRSWWEGWSFDLGPGTAQLGKDAILVFYSNVDMKTSPIRGNSPERLVRKIGILVVKVESRKRLRVKRHGGNPLSYLNGNRGDYNESVFCPGYLGLGQQHAILPAMSRYSLGYPFNQSIGISFGDTPFFEKASPPSLLIDGPAERREILPGISGEIALDSPSLLPRDDRMMLYYSAMDRGDGIWKEVVSVFEKESLLDCFKKSGTI